MKLPPTQFGVRENTASLRQHAPRQTIDSSSVSSETLPRGSQHGQSTPVLSSRAFERCESVNTKRLDVATGGDRGSGVEVFSAPATVSAVNESRQAFEPLIGCEDAAKLLGNIHVKTLQRYARLGTLPGYRVAGHWYFRATELDAWLRSRINSSCHPCRSN
jgi:excisionase family DNA binding protein